MAQEEKDDRPRFRHGMAMIDVFSKDLRRRHAIKHLIAKSL